MLRRMEPQIRIILLLAACVVALSGSASRAETVVQLGLGDSYTFVIERPNNLSIRSTHLCIDQKRATQSLSSDGLTEVVTLVPGSSVIFKDSPTPGRGEAELITVKCAKAAE